MKKLSLIALVFPCLLPALHAQDVKEQMAQMSDGVKNALYMDIPPLSYKQTQEVWKDFIKEYKGKTDYDRKSGELFTDDANMPQISENTVDVYTNFKEVDKNATAVTVWFNLGGAYLNSRDHSAAFLAARQMMADFHRAVSAEVAREALTREEDSLKNIEKNIRDLDRDDEGLTKDIEKARKAIEEAQKKIEENKVRREDLEKARQLQESAIEQAKQKLDALTRKKKDN